MIRTSHTFAVMAALALASTLGACTGTQVGSLSPTPLTPTQRYSLQVEPGVERVALAIHDGGLSDNQRNAVVSIANRFGIEGAPVLRIEAPAGGDPVTSAFAYGVKEQLDTMGVGPVQIVAYNAPDPRAPVLVGYDTVRASIPQCGTSWESLTRTGNNETPSNFGCAVTANLAAQIENPRDIVTPRSMTPADAGRRTVVFDNYRKGEATAATQEQLVANRQLSQAVN